MSEREIDMSEEEINEKKQVGKRVSVWIWIEHFTPFMRPHENYSCLNKYFIDMRTCK